MRYMVSFPLLVDSQTVEILSYDYKHDKYRLLNRIYLFQAPE